MALILSVKTAVGDPRTRTVQLVCEPPAYNNSNVSVSNFFVTMGNISRQMQAAGFGEGTAGSGPDASYGLAQCYGDITSVDCVLCFAAARTNIPACFPTTSGRLYLDGCFMRHENYRFFEEYKGPEDRVVCGNGTRKSSAFQESARRAVRQAVAIAPSRGGFARGKVEVGANESAYVLANCWRTLNASSCRACLDNASTSISRCFPLSEGRVLNTGCFMRYSDVNFLNPEQGNGSSRGTTVIIVVTVISFVAALVIGGAIGVYIWWHRKIQQKRRGSNDAGHFIKILEKSGLNFKYSILEKATGSFDGANKLGQGGYGTVYMGVLVDGREVAVKRLFSNHMHRVADFCNEVTIISGMEHKNLIRLLGCSCSGPESLLVYEFLPNKSLDHFIFDPSKGKTLDWPKRYEIIVGTAEGLEYLHENGGTKIIHRDIKASNILLDSRFHARISDFGMARSFQEDESHISTGIVGTLGYIAPEYLALGRLTEKVDVYSFGVLMLEIVTGRRNNMAQVSTYSDSLLATAWRHFQRGTIEELIDLNILSGNHEEEGIKEEVLRVVHIGFLCTQELPSSRPIMSKVLQMLTKRDEGLPVPANPPFLHEETMELNCMNVG